MEYKLRVQKVTAHLHEGKFVEFDTDELLKLKALQIRATQYILYYTKVKNQTEYVLKISFKIIFSYLV